MRAHEEKVVLHFGREKKHQTHTHLADEEEEAMELHMESVVIFSFFREERKIFFIPSLSLSLLYM